MRIQKRLQNIYDPGWLIQWDSYLLLHYPHLWVTRLHYVFYYGVLLNIFFCFLVWTYIKSHQLDEFINIIIPIVMGAEGLIFILWFIKQFQFNIEKEFGNTNYVANFLEILFYIICTLIIISPSITMTTVAINKVDSSQELYYNIHFLLCTIFSSLGIFLLIAKKNSTWKTIGGIILYLIVLLAVFLFFLLLLNTLYFDTSLFDSLIDSSDQIPSTSLFIVIFTIIIPLIFFAYLSQFHYFGYLNFISLPITIELIILLVNLFDTASNYESVDYTKKIIIFFVLYMFFYPFYKKNLVRLFSLPKK